MAQTIRQKRELHAVATIGKVVVPPKPRADWLDPLWHTAAGYQYAHTHSTSDAFLARQIGRGLTLFKDKK